MKVYRAVLLGAIGISLLASATLFGRDRDVVVLGTATPGGGFPLYGSVFADVVNRADQSLDVQPRNTKGSTENVSLLEEGKLDIALVQGEVALDALTGPGHPAERLKIIAAMYSTAGMFVVRADSSYRSIKDLDGKPVVFGARGSGLVLLARAVLDGIGLDQERDFTAIYLERAGDGPAMVLDGRAAALWGGGIGWPGFDAVAKAPGGARFITPDEGEIERILAKHSALRRLIIPAGSYHGQGAALQSIGSWSFVLARPTLPDSVAYRVVRALHSSEKAMADRLPQARETTIGNTVAAAPRLDLIHPAALRYFREVGLIN